MTQTQPEISTQPCLAVLPCCLFLNIRKSKLSFHSSTCASYCWCRGTFLACTKISSDWFCKAETRNRARYRLRMWKGMRYAQKCSRKKWEQSLSENISTRRHERTKVEKAQTAEYMWDIETTNPTEKKTERMKGGEIESCVTQNKNYISSVPIWAAILGG